MNLSSKSLRHTASSHWVEQASGLFNPASRRIAASRPHYASSCGPEDSDTQPFSAGRRKQPARGRFHLRLATTNFRRISAAAKSDCL